MNADRAAIASTLPAYDIGEELGRGAWGVVLAARHRQLRRDVAIKQLPFGFASNGEVRTRFVAEARLLASLDHPHIVPVYDFVERDGLCLLVMEKMSGGTVWDRFARQGLDAETACAIALVTAVALAHAHERGILHRDVKPENLLFASDGALVKVADFGIAKVLTGGRTLATHAGEILGTPAYMAPEQATGDPVGPATDVYALGVTLFEMLSGRLPFDVSDSTLATLYQRVHEPPLALGEAAPAVPQPLQDVVMTAISTAPDDRHASADEFALVLADAATTSFGRGWLGRAGIRATLGGQIAAITERAAAVVPKPSTSGLTRPRDTHRAPHPLVSNPDDLVLVADPRSDDRGTSLNDLRLLLSRSGAPDAERLAREIERVESGAHELKELALLKEVRSGALDLRRDEIEQVERLLGAAGPRVTDRLDLPEDARVGAARTTAQELANYWRTRAENPLSSRRVVEAARVIVRTCEGILDDLPAPPPT